jgi:hypothetical protein
MRPDSRVLYHLALELAEHGDQRVLRRAERGWSEKVVRRIAGILDVLRKLHRGQLLPGSDAGESVRCEVLPRWATSASSASRAIGTASPRIR